MNAQMINEPREELPNRDRKTIGVVLIVIGVIVLAAQWLDLGLGGLALIGMIFLGAGIATRQAGWFIPGGVLSGIALGAALTDGPLAQVGEPFSGGVFLLSFAAGWVLIALLARIFTTTPQDWAFIPAGVMAFIGGAVLFGEQGEYVLELVFGSLQYIWPLALIIGGVALIVKVKGKE